MRRRSIGTLACAVAALALGPPAAPAAPAAGAPDCAAPAGDPWPAALGQARRVAAERPGRLAYALVDERGRLRGGARLRERYQSASVVKAMLLVAYLDAPGVRGRELSRDERAVLDAMVRRSSNRAATRVRDLVGNDALRRLARRAGMRDFATAPSWGSTLVTAADLARLFWRIDRLVVRRHRAYARALLAGIVPEQRWGIPQAAPAGANVLFKGGWRKLAGARLVTQAALVEHCGLRVALAVLSDTTPDYGDGRRSVLLVARALLAPLREARPEAAAAGEEEPLARAGLARVDGVDLDLRYATARNFTGRRLPGYCASEAWLLPDAARAVERADRRLRRDGLRLRIFDAYRPARATRAMVRWARRTGNDHLLDGYIARRSNHNRGAALDATLVRVSDGRAVAMGTRYDSFTRAAATRAVRGRPLRNRLRLARALEAVGFRPYAREWWHFDWPPGLDAPRLDAPIGC